MDLSHYNQKNLFGADIMLDNFLEPDEICQLEKRGKRVAQDIDEW